MMIFTKMSLIQLKMVKIRPRIKDSWRRKLTYFHPRICPQQQQKISSTVCIPESINLSSLGPAVTLTLATGKSNPIYVTMKI